MIHASKWEKASTGWVYGLKEVGCDEIRYVGATVVGIATRLGQHLDPHNRLRDGTRKSKWINDVLRTGMVEAVCLYECPGKYLLPREYWWMRHLSSLGHRLTNDGYGEDTRVEVLE